MLGIPDHYIEKFDQHFGPISQIFAVVAAVILFFAYHANSYVSKKKENEAKGKFARLETENKRLDSARLELENGQLGLRKELATQQTKRAEAERLLLIKVEELALSQKQIEYLQKPRRLSSHEQDAIVSWLRSIKTDDTKIKFLCAMSSEETTYAEDFRAAFQNGGWNVSGISIFPITSAGISLSIPVRNGQYRNYSTVIEQALTKAGISFTKTFVQAQDEFGDDGQNWGDAPTLQIGQKSYSIVGTP